MKTLSLIAISLLTTYNVFSQEKNFIDHPYIETTAKSDTLVVPDNIYITIILNENDSKNKKSTEELEITLEQTLKKLNINTQKNLSLLDYNSDFKKYFFKGQNILKVKNYSLLVHDAVTAGKVLVELENVGISNVEIAKTEYSKAEELIENLKSSAILKAKKYANKLANPIGQKAGKAIFISDNSATVLSQLQGQVVGIQIRGAASIYGSRAAEPILVDFQKLKFESQVSVRFTLE
ncbi:SIMPL domain-containing protein [Flavobacterium pedocola]